MVASMYNTCTRRRNETFKVQGKSRHVAVINRYNPISIESKKGGNLHDIKQVFKRIYLLCSICFFYTYANSRLYAMTL